MLTPLHFLRNGNRYHNIQDVLFKLTKLLETLEYFKFIEPRVKFRKLIVEYPVPFVVQKYTINNNNDNVYLYIQLLILI